MEKILVGIDDEAASQVAVDWVIDRAQRNPVEVHLYTAFDELFSDPLADEKRLQDTAERITAAAPGSHVTTELDDASIMEGLIERTAGVDLLVIGSHPHRKVRSVLTGAFPAGVATRSSCPTIVVPDDWAPRGGDILLAVAADDSSDAAIRFAAGEARALDVAVEAVHAWEFPVASMDAVAALLVGPDETREAHQKMLDLVTDRLAGEAAGVRIVPRVLHGPDARVLEEAVDSASLVVLGTHRRDPVLGALTGSHVQKLLHHGQVPVAVVGNVAGRGR